MTFVLFRFVFLFNSCLLVMIRTDMKMTSSHPLDQPCEATGSRHCSSSSFDRNPLFIIPYWTIILVMTTIILRATILRIVCA